MTPRQLRTKLKETQAKLNIANNIVAKQIDEIDSLNRCLEIQDKRLKEYQECCTHNEERINRLKQKVKDKTQYYKSWIKETAENNKLKKIIYILAGVCTIEILLLVAILINKG